MVQKKRKNKESKEVQKRLQLNVPQQINPLKIEERKEKIVKKIVKLREDIIKIRDDEIKELNKLLKLADLTQPQPINPPVDKNSTFEIRFTLNLEPEQKNQILNVIKGNYATCQEGGQEDKEKKEQDEEKLWKECKKMPKEYLKEYDSEMTYALKQIQKMYEPQIQNN